MHIGCWSLVLKLVIEYLLLDTFWLLVIGQTLLRKLNLLISLNKFPNSFLNSRVRFVTKIVFQGINVGKGFKYITWLHW
jgi:hypothetical protein